MFAPWALIHLLVLIKAQSSNLFPTNSPQMMPVPCNGSLFGVDFTVNRSVNVTQVGVVVLAETLMDNKNVHIFDRSTDTSRLHLEFTDVARNVNQSLPFVFRPVPGGRILPPGVYTIIVEWDGADRCIRTSRSSNADVNVRKKNRFLFPATETHSLCFL
jgi:hypothetical protein